MKEPRSCKFCWARGIVPVRVVEEHLLKIKTAYHCTACGEVLAVYWEKKKKGDRYEGPN